MLENHHAAKAFKILCNEECNFLEDLDDNDYKEFRKFVISNILYTDMKRHFTLKTDLDIQIKELKNVEKDEASK